MGNLADLLKQAQGGGGTTPPKKSAPKSNLSSLLSQAEKQKASEPQPVDINAALNSGGLSVDYAPPEPEKPKKWYEKAGGAISKGYKWALSPVTNRLADTALFREAGEGMEIEAQERKEAESKAEQAVREGNQQKFDEAMATIKSLPPENFGARLTQTAFDKSRQLLNAVAEPLSRTKFFMEAAEGYEAMERGEVQGSTLDYMAPELLENLEEFSKALSGRGVANVIDTMVASPINYATRSIWGKSNPVGDFFAGVADQMREELTTERSIAISEQQFGWEKIKNPDFWILSIAEQIPTTYAFLRLASGTYGTSNKILTSVLGNSKFATVATSVLSSGVAGTTMRGVESAGEAEEAYKNAKMKGMSEEEAVAAGREVFINNMKLAGLDAFQVALALAPYKLGGNHIWGKIIAGTAELALGGATEGAEETYQYHIQENATGNRMSYLERLSKDPKMQESGFIGAAMGILFEGGGRINQAEGERLRQKYMDDIGDRLPEPFKSEYKKAGSADDKQKVLDRVAAENEKAVIDAVNDLENDQKEAAQATRETIETVRNLPTEGQIIEQLNEGKSPTQVALELGSKIGAEAAETLVRDVVERAEVQEEAQERAAIEEEAPATALADTNAKLKEIGSKLLEQTPADIQSEFTNIQKEFDGRMDTMESEIRGLREQVAAAKDNSPQKKELKKKLAEKVAEFKKANDELTGSMVEQAQTLRDFLKTYIPENFNAKLSADELDTVIDNVADQITSPEALKRSFALPVKEIVARQVQSFSKEKIKTEATKKTSTKDKKEIKTPIEDQAEKARELADKQQKERAEKNKKKSKKEEFKVGDTLDTQGNTNMADPITIREISGNTLKFTDANGIEYSGMASATVRDLLKGGSWKRAENIDKSTNKQDNQTNEPTNNNSGGTDNRGEIPESVSNSEEQPSGAGSSTEVNRGSERGRKRPAKRGDNAGERPRTRLTNEEVAEIVNSVTSVENGEIKITGEITEEVLEAANQYKTGGTEKEGRGILDEYYTNSQIVDLVKSLFNFGTQPLKVLEPAVGTGNFIYALPEIGTHDITAHEINETTAKIAKIFHQNAKVLATSFETNFIDERGQRKDFVNDYDLVIGNPPYGDHRGKYKGLGEEPSIARYEDYFVKRGLDVLKEGGTLAMVLPSSYLDNKLDLKNATLEAAFRLPEGVFEGTKVGTDIVVLKKKLGATTRVGGYFKNNPENILGEIKERKNRFGKMESYVDGDIESALSLFATKHNQREAIQILKDLGLPETADNIETAESAIEEAGDGAKEIVQEETEEQKQAKKQGKKTIEKKIVKQATKEGAPVSLVSQFEGQFTDEVLELWKKTQPDGSIAGVTKPSANTNYLGGKVYLDFNYMQGDIYEKLDMLEKEKSKISAEQYARQKAKLESVLPKRETLDDLRLSPNVAFVKDLKLGKDDKGEDQTLKSAFSKWLYTLPQKAFGGSSRWEVDSYINDEAVRGADKDRNELIRVRRKITADSLFAKFLKDGLSRDEKQIVEDEYNKTFNFYHTPDYKQVPMFSEIHATFKGVPLKIRDVQKHGIGRLVNTGVGILAHDVGFGKTMSGALAVSEVMHRGWANRPLIVAPNENVYRQWISTIEELIPNAKINTLGNLGVAYKGDLSSLKIEEGSISIVTYEGFKRLGFSDETYTSLGSKFAYIADDLQKHKSERDKQKQAARDEEAGGVMKRGTRADLSFEDLGFDHITFDEVHNANHIVSKVKMPQGKSSEFSRFGLRPSDLGIKTWLAAQYIQSKKDGRNVNLLSATPFTNHPLEYYSILSLVADKSLQRMGLQNVNDFFGTFMEAENEYEFKADGTYQKKTDIRRFRNFRQFRKLLDTYIDFKEGDAEGIIRPNRVQQTYEIPQNQLGLDMEVKAQEIFKEDERKEGQGAKVLRAITELRKIAFSPYASKFSEDISPAQYEEFVENSPKIKVLMELLKQNKADKPEAGQIVYVDQVGVQFLPLMKQYMIKKLGYKAEEVEIISGATDKNKRVDIQDKYNAGEIKIILGSEAIKEGMNLQMNTSDLYILSLPWNFTQLRQVIGRAWRQGNMWGNVRINNLFIQDSIDIFLSQKLENKQRRYEAAIKSGENEVDVGDVSFDQLKFDLIRDPETRAKLELSAEKERLSQEITQQEAELAFATRKADKLSDIAAEIASNEEALKEERELQEENKKKGEEPSDFWITRYQDKIKSLKKEQSEELAKLKEKDIDVEKLMKIQEDGQKKIAVLKEQAKTLDDSFNDRVKEIAASLPERQPFSRQIVDALVSERAEQNKTFYKLAVAPVAETIAVQEQVKEIKNADETKVIKTKKTTKAVRSQKPQQAANPADKATFEVLNDTSLSTAEKVDKLLDVKQKGKEFKDIGERVSGSKKERAAIRAVMGSGSGDVFAEMVNRLGIDAVLEVLDKNEILDGVETPSPEKDKAAGVPALVAFTKKDIFDKIQRRFAFKQGRGRYQSPVAWRQAPDSNGWSSIDGRDTEYAMEVIKEYPALLREFVTKLTAVQTAQEMGEFWTSFRKDFPKEIGTLYGETIRVDMSIFGSAVEDYKGFVPRISSYNNEKHVYIGRGSVSGLDVNLEPDELALFEAEISNEKWWEKAIKKGGKREEGVDMKHGNFKPLENIERSAPAIAEEKIKPETLQKEYGFKSVQFGNYMDDATSREHIRHTLGALEDMSTALDLDIPKMIAETGLSMAYGARGGGGANAHYEPAKNIINLTKGRGDGSFFHEFVHYMDLKLAERSYRGKWSSKKTRYYRSDSMDKAALELMDGLVGRHGRKVKEFVPTDDPYIPDRSPVLQWYKDRVPFEEAIEKAKGGEYDYRGNTKVFTYTEGELYRHIAEVYRKTVKQEVDFWHEETNYYKGSKHFGGDYWSRPEELLARAGQAYIEDKLAEKGMKNNYLTRSTVSETEGDSLSKVYPQGEERKHFNTLFDNLFAELRRKFPRTEAKFKSDAEVSTEYGVSEAAAYLNDVKTRLNLDFDVHFVDAILIGKPLNPSNRYWGRIEASGVTADNTIALARAMSKNTAEHEVVHLTLANLDKIPTFKKEGITREAVMKAKAAQMGVELTANELKVEEQLADDFEAYMDNKREPKGIIRKFFALLRKALIKFARAVGITNGDILTDYYEILAEGQAVEEEMVRFENHGILESFIEEGILDIEQTGTDYQTAMKILSDRRAIDNYTKDEMIEAIDYIRLKQPFNQRIEYNIGYLADKFQITDKTLGSVANQFEKLVEGTKTIDISNREVYAPKFKVKDEKDAHVRKLKQQFNDLTDKAEALENDRKAWKTDIEQELIRKEDTAKAVEATPENVKTATKFTKKTPPKGQLTARGESEIEALGFENTEEAQAEITAYLKRKTELVEVRNKLRQLRKDITRATREGKDTAKAMRDVERRLKMRRRFLEQKDFYVNMGVNRGKKVQMKMIARRGRAIKNAQDFFAIGDTRAKKLIGNRRIHLMTESEFNDFLIEFANRAEEMRSNLDAQDLVEAIIAEKQFSKVDNLRLAMGFPPVSKMTEEQANEYAEVLSRYQFGDTFLTKREIETIHRTKWGELKTEREVLEKLKEHTGTDRAALSTLTAPSQGGYYIPWIKLARSHPFYNWLVGKRFEASVKAEREYINVEEQVNKLANAARSSRRKLLSAKELAVELVVPTDDIVFGYMEAENKEAYATEKNMTKEELAFARYLINLYFGAYEYLTSEYGMRGRENYMTHVRRSFVEAIKESGLKAATRELFTSQKEEEAAFKILDEETGNTIAFEKFFGFALKRTGGLVPSKNVARASLAYFQAFAKKKAMDEFVPEAMVALQAHKAVVGTTPKGLTKDPTLEKFVKRFLNDAKGRKVWFGTKQGSNLDIGIRAMTLWISIKYLGFNVASAVANFIGDFTAIFWELSLKEFGRGVVRTLNVPKAHEINKEFRFFTGRNPIVELFDPKYNLPSRMLKSILVMMSFGSFQSNKFFLRSKMTAEEWEKGMVSDQRMTEIAKSLSRVKPNAFYIRSLAGSTTVGKANFQFGSWAVAIFNTVTSDGAEVVKMLKDKKGWETVKSDEFIKLAKFVAMGTLALMLVQLIDEPDDDDDSFWAQVVRKARRELTTLFQALDFVANPANYAIIVREISSWYNVLKLVITQEKYKQDGDGYGLGDPKWTKAFERVITPSVLKNMNPDEKESTKENMIQDAIESGEEFNAEAVMNLYYKDTLEEKEGKELEEYKKEKLGELNALYNLRKKYPDSVTADIFISSDSNKKKVEALVELSKEVGRGKVLDEARALNRDRDLASNPKKKTGKIVSDELYKEVRKALR